MFTNAFIMEGGNPLPPRREGIRALHQAGYILLLVLTGTLFAQQPPQAAGIGVPVSYQLPVTGPLPRTWRVTLAIVERTNSDWIIAQFACGVARTVTAVKQGQFTETWNGLDDNFMPVPPGTYGVKGICMSATKWPVDGEFHSIVPRFLTEASTWQRPLTPANAPDTFGGDPCGAPLTDVAVGSNGVAVFYYQYLENGRNNPMIDLTRPNGYGQFLRAFPSGGGAGGSATTTDGQAVWSFSTDGGRKYVYRADQKPFGTGAGAYRNNVYLPDGWVTAMANARAGDKTFVYIAQRGKIVSNGNDWAESAHEAIDKVTVHDGDKGTVLAELPLKQPCGLVTVGNTLYALHAAEGGFVVSTVTLDDGIPGKDWKPLFTVPKGITPAGFAVDRHARCYISDAGQNHVFQFDVGGKLLHTLGKLPAQRPGSYDPQTFMSPGKMAAWTAPDGSDRLLVVEQAGPNRVSEWDADGSYLRDFLSLQTKANDGYAIDPKHPDHVYISGHRGWLTCFVVDTAKRTWIVDAVWPLSEVPGQQWVSSNGEPHLDHPKFIRLGGHEYLACARTYVVYRREGDGWVLSASLVRRTVDGKPAMAAWHDANGDGLVQDEEMTATTIPRGVLRYHGEQWLDDLSLVATGQGGQDVWRLAPDSFDRHGNAIFSGWQKLLSDPVFAAIRAGTADALHGGNELTDNFSSDWAQTDGSMDEGFYVSARGGRNFDANFGSQHKISRYIPDGKGGFTLKWRTGRAALGSIAAAGEITGGIHLHQPINGLLSIIDQSRCGVILYTTDGLYVDSLFPDGRALGPAQVGVYCLPGEFFAGDLLVNQGDGTITVMMGKYTPQLFSVDGWSLKANPVQPLVSVQPTVTISASQIAAPSDLALSLRGGAGTAKFASFTPAVGGAVLDGSMTGWEACTPVRFQADDQRQVEVRLLYDPEHLYLRWHVRLGVPFTARPLTPIERIFTHDRLADTVSFYLQGDPLAKAEGFHEGRAGDARVVFGLFDDGGTVRPVALGLYPRWPGKDGVTQRYATAAGGLAAFAHVGPVAGAKLSHAMDADGKGFVLVAALPCTSFPMLPVLTGDLRTQVDFEATLGGHAKFWWANSDGSGSRETYDEPTEARLYPGAWAAARFVGLSAGVTINNWLICGPFGGSGTETLSRDPQGGAKDRTRQLLDKVVFPPERKPVDLKATFSGALVRGYWPDPGEVRWHPATIADLDNRVVLGSGAQVWYGATWIHADQESQVEFQFQGHPQTYLVYELNGERVQTGEIREDNGHRVAGKPVQLRTGWNEVRFRGFCVGFPPFRTGLVVQGDPRVLWSCGCPGPRRRRRRRHNFI